jgi:8-oxo-dGTP diphosphatase
MAEIRAAGGIVIRDGSVLLVHRAHYDDWSLPKGKLDEGESWEEAAVRELEEETGLICTLGEEIGRTHYRDASGREKEVRYYRMTSTSDARAQNEIDEIRWVPLAEAAALLTYARDAELLAQVASVADEVGTSSD